MDQQPEVVITGLGVISPIGIGCDPFWDSLRNGRSGVREIPVFANSDLPCRFGGCIVDFEPKQYVTPRKSLKVMGREIQTAYAASALAAAQAGIEAGTVESERIGVVFGSEMMYGEMEELKGAYRECLSTGKMEFDRWGEAAMREIFPLWMLKYLPNMAACHVAIALDARGPNNTLTMDETSSLAAIAEAVSMIERGHADVIVAGGTGSRINPSRIGFSGHEHLARFHGDPTADSRPFDANRRGIVLGEGSAAIVLEKRRHAESRGATILARVLSVGSAYEPSAGLRQTGSGQAVRQSIQQSLQRAGVAPGEVGHVNAHGAGIASFDAMEARGIRDCLGAVPVTALKSYFGHLGAGGGAVELAGALLSLQQGLVPQTLNYDTPDPESPIHVVHGQPLACESPVVLKLNQSSMGHAMAILLGRP